VIDSRVYDLSKVAHLHPGGEAVLYAEGIGTSTLFCSLHKLDPSYVFYVAGKDATETFFGLHRLEILHRPQFARLVIGTISGEQPLINEPQPGDVSTVPYSEASWLMDGFKSAYYGEKHRAFHKAVRRFFDEVVIPDAVSCEESGKRMGQEVVDKMWYVVMLFGLKWVR
jgi:hypothetical protein